MVEEEAGLVGVVEVAWVVAGGAQAWGEEVEVAGVVGCTTT